MTSPSQLNVRGAAKSSVYFRSKSSPRAADGISLTELRQGRSDPLPGASEIPISSLDEQFPPHSEDSRGRTAATLRMSGL